METLQPKTLQEKLTGMDQIINKVCETLSLKPEDINRKCKKRELVDGRKMVCFLSRKHFGVPLRYIGDRIGYRGNNSILQQERTCMDVMATNSQFRATVEGIERELHLN